MKGRIKLVEQALGIGSPWYVDRAEFDPEAGRLDLHLGFERGGTFECGGCGADGCRAYDTTPKSWRHLDFFQHKAYLHAFAPRVTCEACGVRQARLLWARPRNGFTLLLRGGGDGADGGGARQGGERRIVGEHDTRLWRVLKHYVGEARADADHSDVRSVGVDEKACKRGHDYVTFFADLDRARLLYATEGRKAGTLDEFRDDLEAHSGTGEQIEELCMDMSPAYIKGARERSPRRR